ncbi:E3 ubiquitin-protein ligase UBR4-like [Oopsacas minuta]|uniref:E3 ubiquitin-protein ligase UBR4-like n=1 Tax=Oopsacas minuta TaxID=111878 RepID=A0AAV7K118_9METZ|nr:E3 ubiquitin-protein ligase UBR4-like [Oopsacas minuta]
MYLTEKSWTRSPAIHVMLRKLAVESKMSSSWRSRSFRLSPQTVEIGYWVISSVRNIITEISQDNSLSHDLCLFDEADIFDFSTPRSRFNYLVDQIPLISILFSFLINSYTKSFASSVFSFLFECNQTMKSGERISPNLTDNSIKESIQDVFIFLLTSNIPIIDGFVRCQETLFHEIQLLAKCLPIYANTHRPECFSLTPLPLITSHCLTYFSNLFEISRVLTHLIPLPPPNVPTYRENASNIHPFVDFSIFDPVVSSEYYCRVAFSDLPSYFLKFCCDILNLLQHIFMVSHCAILQTFLKHELSHSHVSALCFLFMEVENYNFESKFNLSEDFPNFSINLQSTFHHFLFSGSFDNKFQIYFMEKIGFKFEKWPLFLSETMLFVLSKTILYHMNNQVTSSDHFSIRFLTSFIDSLERKISVISEDHPTDDVNFLHIQLFLFTFSSVPLEYRLSLLVRVIRLILGFSKINIHNLSSILASCRLVLLLEYFVFFLTSPYHSLYNLINACFQNNSKISQPGNIPTSSLDIPFKHYISKYCDEFTLPFPDSIPILYEILDRTDLKVDINSLPTLCNFHSNYSIQYLEIYSELLNLTYNIEAITVSSNKKYYFPHLFHYRYESIKNILSYLPLPDLKPSSIQTITTALDTYKLISLNLPSNSVSMKGNIREGAYKLPTAEFIFKEEMRYQNFLRPIDVIQLAENFFSTVTTSNTLSLFQLLLVSTSIMFKLFETLNSLKKLAANSILGSTLFSGKEVDSEIVDQTVVVIVDRQRFGNDPTISTSCQTLETEKPIDTLASDENQISFPYDNSNVDLNCGDIVNIQKPNEPEASFFESSMLHSSLPQFIISDVSVRLIPLVLKFIDFLSDLCTRYFIIDSPGNFDIIYCLLSTCTVESSSKDLTHFPPSPNLHLFDASLNESSMRVYDSYQQISLSCFDEISLLGANFLENKHSLNDILEQYVASLSVDPLNSLAPMFKHCISTTSSLIQSLIKWGCDEDILSSFLPEISSLIHRAPLLSLPPQCTIDHFISKKFYKLISNASTSLLLQKSFELIGLPNLRYFCNANLVLHTYYDIIIHSVKDVCIYRIMCNILENSPSFNFFSPLFLPIYPEFRQCLTSSINTFADLLIYQKENSIDETSIMVSQLHSSIFLNQEIIYAYFDYAMLGYAGEEEKSIEERCDKLLVLANAISTGGTILPTSTCQFMLISILPLGDKLLDFINQLLTKSRKGNHLHIQLKSDSFQQVTIDTKFHTLNV